MPLCLAAGAPRPWRRCAGRRAHVLVSRHRDGRLIGDVAGRFELSMVYGSSTRGGAAGLIALPACCAPATMW